MDEFNFYDWMPDPAELGLDQVPGMMMYSGGGDLIPIGPEFDFFNWMPDAESLGMTDVPGMMEYDPSTGTLSQIGSGGESFDVGNLVSGATKTVGDLFKGASAWVNDNKTMAGLLASGLLGAASGAKASEAAKAAILAREEVDQRTRQRISDSIIGMKPIGVNRPGLLQTVSGQNIYDQMGRVAR